MYFKSFLKIFKTQLPMLIIYLGIFLGITAVSLNRDEDANTGYENEKIMVAVVDRDNSELSKSLKKYISEKTSVKEIINTEEGMEEALFQRIVEYIVIIPQDFEERMMNGEKVQLESKQVPGAYSAVYAENIVNQYISAICTYYETSGGNADIHKIISQTEKAMDVSVNVKLKQKQGGDGEGTLEVGFNFGAYIVLVCIMWGVSEILSIFFKKNIADRIDVSPVSSLKRNMKLVGYSLFFTIFAWLLIIFVYVIYGADLMEMQNIIRCINMLCLSLVALAAGFLISILVKSKNGRNAVTNTVALGLSFISGAFVPIEMISEGVVKLASFLPVYWYIKANSLITDAAGEKISGYAEVFECIGIQMLFFVAIISVGLVVKRQSGGREMKV